MTLTEKLAVANAAVKAEYGQDYFAVQPITVDDPDNEVTVQVRLARDGRLCKYIHHACVVVSGLARGAVISPRPTVKA